MSDVEKSIAATEHGQSAHNDTTDYSDDREHEAIGGATFDIDGAELPDGYFRSRFFLGTMLAIGLGLTGGVAGFAFAAPILGTIDADIGPVCLMALHTCCVPYNR